MDDIPFQYLHGLAGRSDTLDALVIFFASYFQYVVGLAVLLWFFMGATRDEKRKNRYFVAGAFLAAVISRFVLTEIIRFYYFRPRPFVAENFIPLIPHDLEPSFPSGHAAFFFGIVFFTWMIHPRASAFFLLSALLIGVARVIAGIHYPSDILGGAVVGFLAAWITGRIWQRVVKRNLGIQAASSSPSPRN